MARKVVYLDDLDGTEITEEDGGPVEFSLAGKYYRIDLSSKSLARLEKALAPFINKAEEAEPPQAEPAKAPRGAGRRTRVEPAVDLNAVRTWARENGYEVSNRGRIAGNVMEAYVAAKGL